MFFSNWNALCWKSCGLSANGLSSSEVCLEETLSLWRVLMSEVRRPKPGRLHEGSWFLWWGWVSLALEAISSLPLGCYGNNLARRALFGISSSLWTTNTLRLLTKVKLKPNFQITRITGVNMKRPGGSEREEMTSVKRRETNFEIERYLECSNSS